MNRGDRTGCGGLLFRYKEAIVFIVVLIVTYHYFIGLPQSINLKVIMQGEKFDDVVYEEEQYETMQQNDPRLIKWVRNRYLIPPSQKPYNFKHDVTKFSTPHSAWIRKFFNDKRDGIFIEAGANEGEQESHTLELEMQLGWKGILVECNPTVVPYLRSKHRKAWVAGVCLSTTAYPSVFNFSNPEDWTYSGRFGAAWNLPVPTNWTYFDVESVPLYTLIKALGYTEIDYFSLDVEGIEMEVLKSFPFDKVTIKVIIIEIYFLTEPQRIELEEFLKTKGYTIAHKFGIDFVYVHESAKKSAEELS